MQRLRRKLNCPLPGTYGPTNNGAFYPNFLLLPGGKEEYTNPGLPAYLELDSKSRGCVTEFGFQDMEGGGGGTSVVTITFCSWDKILRSGCF